MHVEEEVNLFKWQALHSMLGKAPMKELLGEQFEIDTTRKSRVVGRAI